MAEIIFASAQDVRDAGNLPATVNETVINQSIDIARRDIISSISKEKYLELYDYKNSTEDEFKAQYNDILHAEANLSMYYLIPVINIETAGSGIVKTKGWDQSRSEIISGNDVDILRGHFKDVAMNYLNDYLISYTGDEDDEDDDDDILSLPNANFIAI